ncbi:MAG: TolC family protein [Elusimicrobia bacterium]|nr:TolC family protein [Elusimicrobiota bacterium]
MKYGVLLTLILSVSLNAAEISLTQAVQKAADRSENVKAALYGKEAAESQLKEVKNSALGKISLKTTYTQGDEPVYAFAQTLRQGKFSMASMASVNNPDSVKNTEFALEGGVPLFTGFKISNYKEMSALGVKAADDYAQRVLSGTKFYSSYLYLTALLRKSLNEELEKILTSSKEELDLAEKLNENGMIPGSDYYAALAIYSGLKNYKDSLDYELKNDIIKLASEIGEEPQNLILSANLTKPLYRDLNCREVSEKALSSRKDLKVYENMFKISEISSKIEKNSILPQAEAFGAFYGNSGAIDSLRTSGVYGLRLTVPFGDPSYFARYEKAQAQSKAAKENFLSEQRKAKTEVLNSCTDYKSSVNSAALALETVQKAEKSLELFRPLYRKGKQSIMEVLRAEQSLFQAKASYLETIYKTHLFYLKTSFAAETLSGEKIKEIEDNLK